MAKRKDFLNQFLASHSVPEDALEHFGANDFTNEFLSLPSYRVVPAYGRILKESGEDYFFSRTINTPSTIPHMVTLQLKDVRTLKESDRRMLKPYQGHKEVVKPPENPDTIVLIHLARPGVDGHPSVIHGGVTCAIFDETIGSCVMLHHEAASGARDTLFTATLSVNFRARTQTPNDVVVKCWLEGRQGRKWKARGLMIDRNGLVLAEAEGLWMETRESGKL
ncbi:uncharacterized protein PV06_04141 [Exophiala oligosperma]|uniref:Thioesterase domain-containing protein n=1 Tax=Exophiala oligosperma TaxID=215243 RepID=A0A0D2B0X8_9EURO|nr:uncharacterized protein PV06_04141 [Exophiala oligosperma]KIW45786.1 hypothetical protein PV06_04141 [Exophiala oligosperma]